MFRKFLSYSSSSTSGSMTGTLVQVIPRHSLQVEAKLKQAFLQEQLFPHGPLQPQCITLCRSGGPASISLIMCVHFVFNYPPLPHWVFFYITQLFPYLNLMINLKPVMKCCTRRWWKKGWINF